MKPVLCLLPLLLLCYLVPVWAGYPKDAPAMVMDWPKCDRNPVKRIQRVERVTTEPPMVQSVGADTKK